jgi:hypothetical protein
MTRTWTTRVSSVACRYQLTKHCPICKLIDRATSSSVLVVGVHVLKRLVEAEIWQKYEEDPFESVADFDYVERRKLQYEYD